jgi:rhamnulose-1-phosphate aldolase/alcohol dehydrogenase
MQPKPSPFPVPELLSLARAAGAREDWVLHGGGNVSAKGWSLDRLGRRVRTLWVKGSGSDMRTLEAEQLTPLDLEALLALRSLSALDDAAMLEELARATLRPGAPRGSIETLLHAFLPPVFVLHTHADATAALIDTPVAKKHVEKCFGGRVGLVPYQRPGFGLSVAVARLFEAGIRAGRPWRAILLDKHGLITWGETGAQALAETRVLLERARRYVTRGGRVPRPKVAPVHGGGIAWLPLLRGALSSGERQILCWDRSAEAVAFSLRPDAARLCAGGPATPDHLLFTKPRALYIAPAAGPSFLKVIPKAVARYRRWYESYVRRYAPKGSIPLDSAPRVVVIKGLGVVTTGRDPRAARVAADIFRHSIWVRTWAAALGAYAPIGLRAAGDFEYWPLENYKLSLAPPEAELSRRVALVTGGGRGIGKACAERLAAAGACVAVLDKDGPAAALTAQGIERTQGSGRALGLRADITDADAVHAAFETVVRTWGGVDVVVQNAGIARTGDVADLAPSDWWDSLEVNVTGAFLVAREAAALFRLQGLGGAMVFVSSKNVPSPSAGFGAYSVSKAAQTQLARVLAQELAPLGVRVNCVAPDGVFEDSGLWERIAPARARAQGLKPAQLRDAYIQRNLLKREVRPRDVAEAVLFFASDRSSRTTGAFLGVDGGLKDAFPR